MQLREYLNDFRFSMDADSAFELLLVSGMSTICPLGPVQQLYCCRDFEMTPIDVTGYGCVKFAEVPPYDLS